MGRHGPQPLKGIPVHPDQAKKLKQLIRSYASLEGQAESAYDHDRDVQADRYSQKAAQTWAEIDALIAAATSPEPQS